MFFMVIERFKHADPRPVGRRFKQYGRMLPEGATYYASWVDSAGLRCFQVMEAPHAELLKNWIASWDDLIEFEVIPVETSEEFWAKIRFD